MEVEEVQLIDAIDKVLAEDVYSLINNPPFNKSAMDGYAVMYEDTNESEKVLQVIDEVFAGEASNNEVTAGTAIKIMTGAPIPKGANAVIKKEDVDLLCTKQIDAVIFDLTDSLGKKDIASALICLKNLLYNKEPIKGK